MSYDGCGRLCELKGREKDRSHECLSAWSATYMYWSWMMLCSMQMQMGTGLGGPCMCARPPAAQ